MVSKGRLVNSDSGIKSTGFDNFGLNVEKEVETSRNSPSDLNQSEKELKGREVVHFVPGSKDDPHKSYRIGKQTLLAVCWIGIGFFNEIIGPTLIDLKDRIGVNYEVISRALVAKSIGSMVGAIMGGFLHERYYRHAEAIIAGGLWLGAVSTVAIPFCNHLALVGTVFSLSGVAEGIINAGGNTLVMDLWGEQTAGPMSSIHFGFGVGALVAPQIAQPFLSPDARKQNEEDAMTTSAPATQSWNATAEPLAESRIEIAYTIVSSIVFVFGFIVLGVYLKGPPKGFVIRQPSNKWKEMLHPSTCGHGYTFFAVELLVVLFWYFIHTVGGERAMSKFLFSFAVETDVQFTKKEASLLQTAFWGSFTAGRLLGVPIGRFVPSWIIVMCDVVGGLVIAIVMSVYAFKNRIAMWVTASFMGFFISIAYPNGMSWANYYLSMNNVSVMILIIGGGCGGFIYQYLGGFLFEKNRKNLPYLMIGYGGCMVIGFVIMQSLAVTHGRKIRKEVKRRDEDDDDVIVVGENVIDADPLDSDSNTRL